MPVSGNYDRPAASPTNTQGYSLSGNLVDDSDGKLTLDVVDNINAADRLICRINVYLPINGQTLAPEVELLRFDSSAGSAYGNTKASPFSDAEADNDGSSQKIKLGQQIDLDTIATTAGAPRT